MSAMGPEAAILSARLAELHATRVDWDLELPRESPMWVEAAVLAGRDAMREEEGAMGLWARLATALRAGRAAAEPPAPLACLPVRTAARR